RDSGGSLASPARRSSALLLAQDGAAFFEHDIEVGGSLAIDLHPIGGHAVGDDLLGIVQFSAFRRRFFHCSGDGGREVGGIQILRSEEHTSELQSRENLVC